MHLSVDAQGVGANTPRREGKIFTGGRARYLQNRVRTLDKPPTKTLEGTDSWVHEYSKKPQQYMTLEAIGS